MYGLTLFRLQRDLLQVTPGGNRQKFTLKLNTIIYRCDATIKNTVISKKLCARAYIKGGNHIYTARREVASIYSLEGHLRTPPSILMTDLQ